MLATPYNPGQGTPNAAGTVEAQSVVPFPRSVKLTRPTLKLTKTVATVAVRGAALTPAGTPVTLRLFRGPVAAATTGSVTLKKSGATFSGTLKVTRKAKRQILFLKVARRDRRGHDTVHPDVRRHVPLGDPGRGRDDQQHGPRRHPGEAEEVAGALGPCVYLH